MTKTEMLLGEILGKRGNFLHKLVFVLSKIAVEISERKRKLVNAEAPAKAFTVALLKMAQSKAERRRMNMNENILKNIDIVALEKEFRLLKRSISNYRCRKCLKIYGHNEEERKCRWCGQELFEMSST